MKQGYFSSLEKLPKGEIRSLNDVLDNLVFNEQELIPVVTQDFRSKKVLMLAWMNRTAIETTLKTKRMTYWSRSRNELWEKGLTSGHKQELVSMSFDCDGDSVLCLVIQNGSACHTDRKSCFYIDSDYEKGIVCIESE